MRYRIAPSDSKRTTHCSDAHGRRMAQPGIQPGQERKRIERMRARVRRSGFLEESMQGVTSLYDRIEQVLFQHYHDLAIVKL